VLTPQVSIKKLDLFTFIEVDDRRDTKTCHAFACEQRGQAPRVIEALGEGLRRAVEEVCPARMPNYYFVVRVSTQQN
jgi:hypothetical protein